MILASNDPSDTTFIIVALIAAVPTTATVLLKWRADNRHNRKRENWLETNVGKANGKGNIVEMLEGNIEWQKRHEAQDRRVAAFLGVPDAMLDPS
jgi:hypothetical protein